MREHCQQDHIIQSVACTLIKSHDWMTVDRVDSIRLKVFQPVRQAFASHLGIEFNIASGLSIFAKVITCGDHSSADGAALFSSGQHAFSWIRCCLSLKQHKEIKWDRTPIAVFANDADRREFICAGAAAGIAVTHYCQCHYSSPPCGLQCQG